MTISSSLNRVGAACLGSLLLLALTAHAQNSASPGFATGPTGSPILAGVAVAPTVGGVASPQLSPNQGSPQPSIAVIGAQNAQDRRHPLPDNQDLNARKNLKAKFGSPMLGLEEGARLGLDNDNRTAPPPPITLMPGVPVSIEVRESPSSPDGVRIVRITNIRANANQLGVSSTSIAAPNNGGGEKLVLNGPGLNNSGALENRTATPKKGGDGNKLVVAGSTDNGSNKRIQPGDGGGTEKTGTAKNAIRFDVFVESSARMATPPNGRDEKHASFISDVGANKFISDVGARNRSSTVPNNNSGNGAPSVHVNQDGLGQALKTSGDAKGVWQAPAGTEKTTTLQKGGNGKSSFFDVFVDRAATPPKGEDGTPGISDQGAAGGLISYRTANPKKGGSEKRIIAWTQGEEAIAASKHEGDGKSSIAANPDGTLPLSSGVSHLVQAPGPNGGNGTPGLRQEGLSEPSGDLRASTKGATPTDPQAAADITVKSKITGRLVLAWQPEPTSGVMMRSHVYNEYSAGNAAISKNGVGGKPPPYDGKTASLININEGTDYRAATPPKGVDGTPSIAANPDGTLSAPAAVTHLVRIPSPNSGNGTPGVHVNQDGLGQALKTSGDVKGVWQAPSGTEKTTTLQKGGNGKSSFFDVFVDRTATPAKVGDGRPTTTVRDGAQLQLKEGDSVHYNGHIGTVKTVKGEAIIDWGDGSPSRIKAGHSLGSVSLGMAPPAKGGGGIGALENLSGNNSIAAPTDNGNGTPGIMQGRVTLDADQNEQRTATPQKGGDGKQAINLSTDSTIGVDSGSSLTTARIPKDGNGTPSVVEYKDGEDGVNRTRPGNHRSTAAVPTDWVVTMPPKSLKAGTEPTSGGAEKPGVGNFNHKYLRDIRMMAKGSDGQVLPFAEVQIQDASGKTVGTGTADEKGCISWAPTTPGKFTMSVHKGDESPNKKHSFLGTVTLVR